MGSGMTGYLQATEEQRSWLPECYKYLREFDKQYSKEHNMPESIKLTTFKPSGTLSLIGNVTPGIHPGFSKFYIRRVRFATNHSLVNIAKQNGYHVEFVKNFDGTYDHNTVVISFPFKLDDNTIIAENCSAIQQLEWIKRAQTDWSDNSVSCTVYYRKEELQEIKEWLIKYYNDNIKTVSFLLHSEHGFEQAPMEKISENEYNDMIKNITVVKSLEKYNVCNTIEDEKHQAENECKGGMCPLK
jgi:ribonucleotide reductase alpha subunit